jgi:predicted O-methyltransferase YrrM
MKLFYKILERVRYLIKFIRYLLFSEHWRGFGIHSPFVFDFYRNILRHTRKDDNLNAVKKTRKRLRNTVQFLYTLDFGTGGEKRGQKYWLPVHKAEERISIPHKYGKILYSLLRYYPVTNVLEIGTGVGVSTLYMATGNPSATIITLEGCPQKSQFAEDLFNKSGFSQIKVKTGSFDDTLLSVLKESESPLDLVFIDGNHSKQSTLRYFEKVLPNLHNDSIIVFDDIHWSKGMSDAWDAVKERDEVTVTIDLFRLGIVFIKKELSKQNFMIRY